MPKLDEDAIKWDDKILQTRYAGWKSGLDKSSLSYLAIPFEDWKIEHKALAEYCKGLPPNKRPLFNDWLLKKKDMDINQSDDAVLPFGDDTTSYIL